MEKMLTSLEKTGAPVLKRARDHDPCVGLSLFQSFLYIYSGVFLSSFFFILFSVDTGHGLVNADLLFIPKSACIISCIGSWLSCPCGLNV